MRDLKRIDWLQVEGQGFQVRAGTCRRKEGWIYFTGDNGYEYAVREDAVTAISYT